MRRQWKCKDGFLQCLASVWFFGWVPLFIGIWAIGAPNGLNSEGNYGPALAFLAIWFGVVIVPALTVGAIMLAVVLWKQRPRRVTEPVLTDLREAE